MFPVLVFFFTHSDKLGAAPFDVVPQPCRGPSPAHLWPPPFPQPHHPSFQTRQSASPSGRQKASCQPWLVGLPTALQGVRVYGQPMPLPGPSCLAGTPVGGGRWRPGVAAFIPVFLFDTPAGKPFQGSSFSRQLCNSPPPSRPDLRASLDSYCSRQPMARRSDRIVHTPSILHA